MITALRISAILAASSFGLGACVDSRPVGNLPQGGSPPAQITTSTSGWAVCWATVYYVAQGNQQGQIGGPFAVTPPGPPASPLSIAASRVVSNVFQWSGSTSGYSTQFDQYLAAQIAGKPVLGLPPPGISIPTPSPSQCDFEATLQQVLNNAIITEIDWPGGGWPQGSPPQGWGFCFIEPQAAGSKNLYYTSDFKWAGDQGSYRTGFVNFVKTQYHADVSTGAETCTFIAVPLSFQTVAEDPILSARETENSKAVNQGWSIVSTDWDG